MAAPIDRNESVYVCVWRAEKEMSLFGYANESFILMIVSRRNAAVLIYNKMGDLSCLFNCDVAYFFFVNKLELER